MSIKWYIEIYIVGDCIEQSTIATPSRPEKPSRYISNNKTNKHPCSDSERRKA
jgi:hypothetical protein